MGCDCTAIITSRAARTEREPRTSGRLIGTNRGQLKPLTALIGTGAGTGASKKKGPPYTPATLHRGSADFSAREFVKLYPLRPRAPPPRITFNFCVR